MGVFFGTLAAGITIIFAKYLRLWSNVDEFHVGFRIRNGAVVKDKNGDPKIFLPGKVGTCPIIHSVDTVFVGEQNADIVSQDLIFGSWYTTQLTWSITYQVADPYKANYTQMDFKARIHDIATGLMSRSSREHSSPKELTQGDSWKEFRKVLKRKLKKIGVELLEIKINDQKDSDLTIQLLHAKASMKERFGGLCEILDDTAKAKKMMESPQLAAAISGIPVSTAITQDRSEYEAEHESAEEEEDKDEKEETSLVAI
jgi:hypothetical protein